MDEFQIVEYGRHLNNMRRINENISEHLFGSVIYLLKYSEKYSVKLPKKEELERIILNMKPLLESYNQSLDEFEKTMEFFRNSDQPKGNRENINREGNSASKQNLY
ncbi:MAG TPA: hypothetical protein VLD38_08015 [Nitrosopumilaceae archaeon]|nr:hypothetical protein [Nitrosopumilaceae archaeon]